MKNIQETQEIVNEVKTKITIDKVALPSLEKLRQSGPFQSQQQFIDSSLVNFAELLRLTSIHPASRLLDYGCGLGRLCIPLAAFLNSQGSYIGIDTDADCIEYLRGLHNRQSFSFHHKNIYSKMYNPKGEPMEILNELDIGEAVDLSFLFSVFTHVLPEDIKTLLKFLRRILKPDGEILASFFILNDVSYRGIQESTAHRQFSFNYKNAKIDNKNVPEGAVAYIEADLKKYFQDCGLSIRNLSYGNWSGQVNGWHWQDLVVLTPN